jgi:heme A synthase
MRCSAKSELIDFLLRLLLGGAAVAATYLAVQLLPWPEVGGILAAFPAVLASAVGLSGWRDGDRVAAQVARGAVAGMLGGVAAVGVTWVLLAAGTPLGLAISGGLVGWFTGSLAVLQLRRRSSGGLARQPAASGREVHP